jgi:hypothetical protein
MSPDAEQLQRFGVIWLRRKDLPVNRLRLGEAPRPVVLVSEFQGLRDGEHRGHFSVNLHSISGNRNSRDSGGPGWDRQQARVFIRTPNFPKPCGVFRECPKTPAGAFPEASEDHHCADSWFFCRNVTI